MDGAVMGDRATGTNVSAALGTNMDHAEILDVAVRADLDLVRFGTDHGIGPDRGARPYGHLAKDLHTGMDKCGIDQGDVGTVILHVLLAK